MNPLEDTGEVVRIAELKVVRDLLDKLSRLLEKLRRSLHLEALKVLIGTDVIESTKQAAEIRRIYVAGSGGLI